MPDVSTLALNNGVNSSAGSGCVPHPLTRPERGRGGALGWLQTH
jgi:hypothetical protein